MKRRSKSLLAVGAAVGLSACASPGGLRIEPAARTKADLVYDQNARGPADLTAPNHQVLDAEGNVVFTPGRHPALLRRMACVPVAVERVEASRRAWRAGNGIFWSGIGLVAVGVSGLAAAAALSSRDGASTETALFIGGGSALFGGALLSQVGVSTWSRSKLRVLDAVNAYNDQRDRFPACRSE